MVVVGSGPNGLAAAITVARAGLSVLIVEGADTPGGGCRTEQLIREGFVHDLCASAHPLAAVSPFLAPLIAQGRGAWAGVRLLRPEVAVAHPLGGALATSISGDPAATAAALGPDGPAYKKVMTPLVEHLEGLLGAFLAPPGRLVPSPLLPAAAFTAVGILPAGLICKALRTEEARALVAGLAAHSVLPLSSSPSSAYGLLLGALAHAVGWPVVAGGSGQLARALVEEAVGLGAELQTGCWVSSLKDLPPHRAVLADLTPRQLVGMAGGSVPSRVSKRLQRFRYGPGVCKVDWALAGPIPWDAEACRRTATVHVGGSFAEVASSEAAAARGGHSGHPFSILVQPGVVDPSRAPGGAQAAWAYCHVPSGSDTDVSALIEAQVERFAPGFRDLILGRFVQTAKQMERHNPNYVDGDIGSGLASLGQTLARPTWRWNPYRSGVPGVYLCGASTPPGGGVHGMCGYWAARTALADLGLGSDPFEWGSWKTSLLASVRSQR